MGCYSDSNRISWISGKESFEGFERSCKDSSFSSWQTSEKASCRDSKMHVGSCSRSSKSQSSSCAYVYGRASCAGNANKCFNGAHLKMVPVSAAFNRQSFTEEAPTADDGDTFTKWGSYEQLNLTRDFSE